MEGDLPRHVCVTIHPSSPHHHLSLIRVTGSAGAHPKVRNTPRTPSPKKHLSSIQNENQKKSSSVLCSNLGGCPLRYLSAEACFQFGRVERRAALFPHMKY